jgi:hypothetical protein
MKPCFAAVVAVVLFQCSEALGQTTLAEAARAFDEAALRAGDDNSKPRSVRRWTAPIQLAFANPSAAPALVEITRQGVKVIATEAGIGVSDAAQRDTTANYVVFFDENGLRAQAGDCSATGWWDNKGAIYKAELRINPVRIRDIDRCAVHEPMHSFGFFSHPHSALSILSYVYKAQRTLTVLDQHLIRTLYDSRMMTGMATVPASRLACRILGERLGASAADVEATCRDRKGPTP